MMDRDQKRREFLKTGLVAGAAIVSSGPGILLGRGNAHAKTGPDVIIARGDRAEAITRAAVDALGGRKMFVKPGAKVLIKPNMSFARRPDEACNTNPKVVAEVARMCSEAGASQITVMEL